MQQIFIPVPFRDNVFPAIDHAARFLAMSLIGGAR